MVDPLAAAIISRPSCARILGSALDSMARRSRQARPADFFSPLPPKQKGKEKAIDPPALQCSQCPSHTTSTSCVSRHSLWCPIRNRLLMMNQVIPRRSQLFPQPSQRWTRRHSSSAARAVSSQTRPQIVRPSQEPQESADTLRSLLSSGARFDPEHAWRLYMASIRADANDQILTQGEQIQFIRLLVGVFQLYGDAAPDLPLLCTWGSRLEPILRSLESNLGNGSTETISVRSFAAQACAWRGDVAQASSLVRQLRESRLSHAETSTLLSVYRDILVLSRYQHDASHALDLLMQEWVFLGPFCQFRSSSPSSAASFRKAIHNILADIPDGAHQLLLHFKMDPDDRSRLGDLLLEAYCAKKLLHQAHAVVVQMRKLQLPVRFHLETKLTRLLAQRNLFPLADEIFSSINPSTNLRLYHATGLHLYARRGDVDRAEEFFAKHRDNNWSMPAAQCMLMHAYAVASKADKVVELFHQFFPSSPQGDFTAELPSIQHYTTVILAHAQLADFDGIDAWLDKMLQAGCRPDGHIYSIVVQSFARHGDVDSVAALFDQMRAAGVQPDRFHYTSTVALLARRKDVVAAEALYRRALRDGIVPDRMMITSLMNAHVEAGSWEGVIRIFDYMRQSSRFRCDLSIEVYNTLLKAYVLIGTPFRIVFAIFRKVVGFGLRPDGYTYALVIQSACDAGMMVLAEELFAEMERKARAGDLFHRLSAHVLTTIMAGHARQGSKEHARACYEALQRRGMRPNSRTYKQVLQTYANDRTEEGLTVAESFLKEIMSADGNDPSWAGSETRRSALGNIHSPLMLVYARKREPEEVVRLFNDMLDAGGEPSLESLTIILDAHRRTGNVDAIQELWPQVWTAAIQRSTVDGLFRSDDLTPTPRRQSHFLCLPLSIYIDAMSMVGEHRAVLEAWTRAKAQGFSFDVHNWNHLSIALVRAGELDRAFEVLERVLIPYSRKEPTARDPSPETPLMFDAMPDEDMPSPDSPAMHRKAQRARAVRQATNTVGSMQAMPEESTDFAHPLHMLHQVIPGMSMWRPHAVTLRILSNVLAHLQRGHLVEPVRAGDAPPATPPDHADVQSRVEAAHATLQRIYHSYPEAVRAVLAHDRAQAQRDAMRRPPREWVRVKEQAVDTLAADGDTNEMYG